MDLVDDGFGARSKIPPRVSKGPPPKKLGSILNAAVLAEGGTIHVKGLRVELDADSMRWKCEVCTAHEAPAGVFDYILRYQLR